MQYVTQSYPYYRGDDGRSLLLPLLVGAAVGFPLGYIASNSSNNNQQMPMPYYYPYPAPQPYYMPMQYPTMQQPYMPMPY